MHALQSSLDVLRTHRPDFTPRTGFVWPIVDAPTQGAADSLAKKRSTEDTLDVANESSDSLLTAAANSDLKNQKDGSIANNAAAAAKKQENILPLLNAMRTTVAHATATFAAPESSQAPGTIMSSQETPRASSTPGPTQSTREETPASSAGVFFPCSPDTSLFSCTVTNTLAGVKKRKKREFPFAFFVVWISRDLICGSLQVCLVLQSGLNPAVPDNVASHVY